MRLQQTKSIKQSDLMPHRFFIEHLTDVTEKPTQEHNMY
jgi:hypothetical protein